MGIEPNNPAEPADAYIGRKAVDLGLITANQLRDVLLQLSRPGVKNPPTLGSTLVEKGLITAQQLGVISDLAQRTTPQRIGKYGIVRELGKGGMGIVYEAEDPELGRRVALKMLLLEFNLNPSESAVEEERFTREARLSANLPKHPNIVGVYEAGVAEGQRFIAMEYVEGKQFSDWRVQKAVTLRQQIAVLRDAALAVDHAHRHNVVHRDLKPANILVDADLQPHVTDFGLAKRERGDPTFALTATGTVMGTPAYMSPEQAEGKRDVDSRADIWALGVMLYEILTGRVPFEAETPLKVVMRTVKDPVTPPSGLLRGASLTSLDRTLEAVCMKALAKNPKGRHATARLFADDLTRWIKGEKGTVRRAPPQAPRTWIYAGVAAAVIVLIAAVYLALSPSSSEEAAERARDYVGQGQRLLAQGKYSDALVKFGQALSEDPGNRAAVAGRKEAEGKLIAAAQPPPAPVGPSKEETEKKAIAQDLAELDTLIASYRGKENYGPARELLTQALRRRERADWVAAITVRQEDLKKDLDSLFETLKSKAADLKRRGDGPALEALKTRVGRWGLPSLSKELDDALAVVKAPEPRVSPSSPAPLTGTATELPPVRGFRNAVNSMSFAADEKTLITTDFDRSVRLWDISRSTERAALAGGEGFTSSAGSADGRWLAAGSTDGKIRLWDSATLKLRIFTAHGGQVMGISFSPDSTLFASCSVDGIVRIWDPVAGLPRGAMEGHPKGAMSVAFSPDGKQVAVGAAELMVKLWDVASGREIRRYDIEPGSGILGVAFMPDGKTLAGGGQSGKLYLWDVGTGKGRVLGSHTKGIRGLTIPPDGRWIATVSQDGLRVWDPNTGLVVLTGSEEGGFFSVAASRKGNLLAGGGANWSVRLWDMSAFSK